ncbi:AAA family ATPase [Streptomyces sp. NPDC006733]|uniref:AAA family ATPase n=1 Tax=Streptomyces sp. NPDC006733 TaxID=3155460 RepID=UPI0033FEF6A0
MVLLGRAAETQRLTGLIADVHERGGALAVRGTAGIGKSALLAYATAHATAAGMRVLTTAGVECETHLPYAGLQQLLYPIRTAVELIPPEQQEALRAALSGTDRAAPDLFLVALAVLNVVAEAAEGAPVLLVAEDSHWLDPSTSHVLGFVARRLESEPIVLLAAAREGFHSWLDDAELPELTLSPLDAAAADALLRVHAPDLEPALRTRLLTEAAGNPLALTELPRATRDPAADGAPLPAWLPLTERLERAFTARLSGLPAATRTLLQVAALNDSVSLAESTGAAQAVTGGRTDAAVLVPAITAGLIDIERGELRFRHPLMRSAIHQSMTLPERQAAHRALSAALIGQEDRSVWHRAAATALPDEAVAAAPMPPRCGPSAAAASGPRWRPWTAPPASARTRRCRPTGCCAPPTWPSNWARARWSPASWTPQRSWTSRRSSGPAWCGCGAASTRGCTIRAPKPGIWRSLPRRSPRPVTRTSRSGSCGVRRSAASGASRALRPGGTWSPSPKAWRWTSTTRGCWRSSRTRRRSSGARW